MLHGAERIHTACAARHDRIGETAFADFSSKSIRQDGCIRGKDMEKTVKIAVIGGGPAGLAAAASAVDSGVQPQDILILERADELGGILNQCIHNGFGLHTFKEELTGPEYAARFIDLVLKDEIPYMLNTMVIDISRLPAGCPQESAADETAGCAAPSEPDGPAETSCTQAPSVSVRVTAMNGAEGLVIVKAQAVILAMGCRERPRGALNTPGYRPAGIYTAGTAQRFVNLEGRMPGHEVVILGSGDIGLIMARRMTLEGAKVKVVAELMPYSGGLKRNIVQCLNDYDIPLKLSHTVIDIRGKERVESVVIAEVGPDRKPIPGTEEEYTCDTLLLSCGLIPENELTNGLGASMSRVTNGPLVNESLETDIPGVFACGNVLHVHDLVDYVSEEAAQAGANAAAYVLGKNNAAPAGAGAADGAKAPSGGANSGAAGAAAAAGSCADSGAGGKAGFPDKAPEDPMAGAVAITATDGVRYTVPSCIRVPHMADRQKVRFRVGNEYRNASIRIELNDTVLRTIRKQVLAPGEMEEVILKKSDLEAVPDLQSITFRIVPAAS